jgi:hypothetical protein
MRVGFLFAIIVAPLLLGVRERGVAEDEPAARVPLPPLLSSIVSEPSLP